MISLLRILLLPIVNSIINGTDYSAEWDHLSKKWKRGL